MWSNEPQASFYPQLHLSIPSSAAFLLLLLRFTRNDLTRTSTSCSFHRSAAFPTIVDSAHFSLGFIGGNSLSVAPPGRVHEFVKEHGGHTVITKVRGIAALVRWD
jgi:hypothetical protein